MSRRTVPTPHGPSPEALRQQLQKANLRNDELQAEVDSYRALDRTHPSRLLVELASTLAAAAEASKPIHAKNYDVELVKYSKGPPDQGAPTRGARRAETRLIGDLDKALNVYGSARARSFAPLKKADVTAPLVRCRRRDCPACDITIPAWRVIRGGRKIYNERCSSCGEMLSGDRVDA